MPSEPVQDLPETESYATEREADEAARAWIETVGYNRQLDRAIREARFTRFVP
jgi:hypothetical protein